MKLSIHDRGTQSVLRRTRRFFRSDWDSKAMTKDVHAYRDLLIKSIYQVFMTREPKAVLRSLIHTKRATKATKTAVIRIEYRPHPLSHFQIKQTAITKGRKMKRVTSRKGLGYSQTLTGQKSQSTLVRVKRRGRLKLSHGKLGFKGFLQSLNDQIFERKQRATWYGTTRAPIQRLYGLSFSQMATNRDTQELMKPWAKDKHYYWLELEKL